MRLVAVSVSDGPGIQEAKRERKDEVKEGCFGSDGRWKYRHRLWRVEVSLYPLSWVVGVVMVEPIRVFPLTTSDSHIRQISPRVQCLMLRNSVYIYTP